MIKCKNKNISLIIILLIGLSGVFSGCIGLENKNNEKYDKIIEIPAEVNGTSLLVTIEKHFYSTIGDSQRLDVSINITNKGKEDIDLDQFSYYINRYNPSFKAYQDRELRIYDLPILGFMGSYKIGPEKTLLWSKSCPETEEKYKFIIKKEEIVLKSQDDEKINITNFEFNITSDVLYEMEFSISPDDWNIFSIKP